jgi:preprotein translocase subunit SecG
MENLQNLLLIVHIITAVLLIVLVLLQPSSSDGGFVSSMNNSQALVSGRSAANFLTKLTGFLAALFMLNSLALATLAHRQVDKDSQIDKFIKQKTQETPAAPLAE